MKCSPKNKILISSLSEDSENLKFEFMSLPTLNKHILPGKGNEKQSKVSSQP